jgi:hypothetical protein
VTDTPAEVADTLIETFGRNDIEAASRAPKFRVGDRVKIVSSPYCDKSGRCDDDPQLEPGNLGTITQNFNDELYGVTMDKGPRRVAFDGLGWYFDASALEAVCMSAIERLQNPMRFSLVQFGYTRRMEAYETGEYVAYKDYEDLLADYERLRAMEERVKGALVGRIHNDGGDLVVVTFKGGKPFRYAHGQIVALVPVPGGE